MDMTLLCLISNYSTIPVEVVVRSACDSGSPYAIVNRMLSLLSSHTFNSDLSRRCEELDIEYKSLEIDLRELITSAYISSLISMVCNDAVVVKATIAQLSEKKEMIGDKWKMIIKSEHIKQFVKFIHMPEENAYEDAVTSFIKLLPSDMGEELLTEDVINFILDHHYKITLCSHIVISKLLLHFDNMQNEALTTNVIKKFFDNSSVVIEMLDKNHASELKEAYKTILHYAPYDNVIAALYLMNEYDHLDFISLLCAAGDKARELLKDYVENAPGKIQTIQAWIEEKKITGESPDMLSSWLEYCVTLEEGAVNNTSLNMITAFQEWFLAAPSEHSDDVSLIA